MIQKMTNQNQQHSERNAVQEPLQVRAAFAPNTLNEEKRTATVIFGSDAPVRMATEYGIVNESLAFDQKSVRLDRLNDGAPLLDNHNVKGPVLDTVVGVVERAWVDGTRGHAVVRFANTAKGQQILEQVREGIIRNISVGYSVYKYKVEKNRADGTELYRAIDWEPKEISLVSVPADANAKVRSFAGVEVEPDADVEYNETLNRRGAELKAFVALHK